MALGSGMIKTNLDPDTTDPKAGRGDLVLNVDDYNTTLTHLGLSPLLAPADPVNIGDGLEIATAPDPDELRVRLQTTSGLARTTDGLAIDVNNLPAITAPQPGDFVAVHDIAPTAARAKITWSDAFKVIDGFTAKATPDAAADYVAVYSGADMDTRKVAVGKLGGGWETVGADIPWASGATLDIPLDGTSGADYELVLTNLSPTVATHLYLEFHGSGGHLTGTVSGGMVGWDSAGGSEGNASSDAIHWVLTTQNVDIIPDGALTGTLRFVDSQAGDRPCQGNGSLQYKRPMNRTVMLTGHCALGINTAVAMIRLRWSAGAADGGSVRLRKIKGG